MVIDMLVFCTLDFHFGTLETQCRNYGLAVDLEFASKLA